jgi:hypothetical protein
MVFLMCPFLWYLYVVAKEKLGSLILRIQAGDKPAFDRLYAILYLRFFPSALGFFRGDEDKVWDTFCERAFLASFRFKGRVESLGFLR